MAKLPTLRRISREDVKEAPAWIDTILYALNTFFESIYYTLNKNITFEDNILSQRVSFELKAGAAAANNVYHFASDMTVPPKMLLVGKVELKAAVFTPLGGAVWVDWYYQDGQIYIQSISGLTSGSTYKFELLLI